MREVLKAGEDYYRVWHNLGGQPFVYQVSDTDGSLIDPTTYTEMQWPDYIDFHFWSVLEEDVVVRIITSDSLPAVHESKSKQVVPDENEELVVHEFVNDFEEALNLLQQYQRSLRILNSPDPSSYAANKLLKKYRRNPEKVSEFFRIIVDGIDITEHPDSIPGTAVEVTHEEIEIVDAVVVDELESGDNERNRD